VLNDPDQGVSRRGAARDGQGSFALAPGLYRGGAPRVGRPRTKPPEFMMSLKPQRGTKGHQRCRRLSRQRTTPSRRRPGCENSSTSSWFAWGGGSSGRLWAGPPDRDSDQKGRGAFSASSVGRPRKNRLLQAGGLVQGSLRRERTLQGIRRSVGRASTGAVKARQAGEVLRVTPAPSTAFTERIRAARSTVAATPTKTALAVRDPPRVFACPTTTHSSPS